MTAMYCRRSTLVAALFAAASLSACSDPVSPSDLVGVYVLENPAALVSPDYRIVADTIFLNPDGAGSKRTYIEVFDPQFGQTQFMSSESFFSYELAGVWLVANPACVGCIDLVGHTSIKYLLTRDGMTRAPEGEYVRL